MLILKTCHLCRYRWIRTSCIWRRCLYSNVLYWRRWRKWGTNSENSTLSECHLLVSLYFKTVKYWSLFASHFQAESSPCRSDTSYFNREHNSRVVDLNYSDTEEICIVTDPSLGSHPCNRYVFHSISLSSRLKREEEKIYLHNCRSSENFQGAEFLSTFYVIITERVHSGSFYFSVMQCESMDEAKNVMYHSNNQQNVKTSPNSRTRRSGILTVTEKPPGIFNFSIFTLL